MFAADRGVKDFRIDTMRELTSADELGRRGCYDLAFVLRTFEYLDKERTCAFSAALRGLHAQRLLTVVPIGSMHREHKSRLEDSDFFACVFTRFAGIQEIQARCGRTNSTFTTPKPRQIG